MSTVEAAFGGSGSSVGTLATDIFFELGLKYCAGRDVALDLIAAHKWFNIAALRGNVEARRYRAELSSEMSRRDVSTAQRLAREWLARN